MHGLDVPPKYKLLLYILRPPNTSLSTILVMPVAMYLAQQARSCWTVGQAHLHIPAGLMGVHILPLSFPGIHVRAKLKMNNMFADHSPAPARDIKSILSNPLADARCALLAVQLHVSLPILQGLVTVKLAWQD